MARSASPAAPTAGRTGPVPRAPHWPRTLRLLALTVLLLLLPSQGALADNELVLWHVYHGKEKAGIEAAIKAFNHDHPELRILPQDQPFNGFSSKLRAAIPRGNGPDLFIYNHDQIGGWVAADLLEPQEVPDDMIAPALEGIRYQDETWAQPLACKTAALFYNTELVLHPPGNVNELWETAHRETRNERYGLVYEATSIYHNAGWFLGAGGAFFDPQGNITVDTPEMTEALAFAHRAVLVDRVCPEEATSVLVGQMFNDGNAAMVINGPWFLSEIDGDTPFAVAPLPQPARPLLTVESVFVSSYASDVGRALQAARLLAGAEYEDVRIAEARQVVARPRDYGDPILDAFAESTLTSVPTPNLPQMALVWEPGNAGFRRVVRGASTPEEGAVWMQRRAEILNRPLPPEANPTPTLVIIGLLCLAAAVWSVIRARRDRIPRKIWAARPAYAYLAPAAIGMLLLLVLPFVTGSALSFFAHRAGEYRFVGLQNFASILFAQDYSITDPLSFYFTLGVTTLWTLCNVTLHVTIGMAIAMLLRDPWMKLRGFYRVLLIVPWAIPNYITALIWKGMFNKQFGAINGLLDFVGVEPVGWFSQFWTAFAANLCTNTWLGFPFMMVVTLGALQAIPRDLEEAAEVDGASRWQRFRHVVLPLLKPALLPAVILGTIWTFQQSNIFYLVSAGEPDGGTEILISEAYRWAFSREAQYGYAAAYAVLIFGVLLLYTQITDRLSARSREV